MKKSVDKIIITNLPSFYKINLYNEIGKHCKIYVIYTMDHANGRNKDFYSGDMEFEHIFLKENAIARIFQLISILLKIKYQELILSGWDSIPLWIGAFISPKAKNSVVIESSYHESATTGIKGFIKKIFISRISKVYASGKAQKRITDNLGFTGKTIITKGVGIFNYIKQPKYTPRTEVKNFLYVGRLTRVKNLEFLIDRFNQHPELKLQIIGFGELEEKLKSIANNNIEFIGAVDNKKLGTYYQNCDVFILPSLIEPWGLVIEEALNNGTPVMASNRVGCAEEIITPNIGEIFTIDDTDFELHLANIKNIVRYNSMREHISKLDFESIEKQQVLCYIK